MTRPVALIATLLFTAACSKGDAPATDTAAPSAAAAQAPAGTGDDLADVTSYRLTMDRIDKFYAAQRNVALAVSKMTPGERAAFEAQDDADADTNESIDDLARKLDGHPVSAKAISDAGISAREFALMTMSIVQTGMAASVLEMRPKDNRDSLIREMKANPENVEFFRANKAELDRKQAEYKAEMERLGLSEKR